MIPLRVIDFGKVSSLRSQTIWHALAASVGRGAPMTLSFMRPDTSYVGIGLHRSIEEIDRSYCESEGLAIIRRQVGGGPVYLDENQLFFQIAVDRDALPRSRSAAIDSLLRPLTEAFRAAGVNADLDSNGEFSVDGAKVCGHGAGEIGDGVVVVGNLIENFDAKRASAILNTGSDWIKTQVTELMQRYVGSFAAPVNPREFILAARSSLARAFDARAFDGVLSGEEWDEVAKFDELLGDQSWTAEPEFLPAPPRPMRIIKIRAGVYVVYRTSLGPPFFFSTIFGRIGSMALGGSDLRHPDVAEVASGEELGVAVSALVERGYLTDAELSALFNAGVLTKEATAQWVA